MHDPNPQPVCLQPPIIRRPDGRGDGDHTDTRLLDLVDCLPDRVKPEDEGTFIEYNSRTQPRDNGGTVLAIAGGDYCLVAADTRLSDPGYRICSRNVSRLLQVSPECFVGMAGSWSDMVPLRRELDLEISKYSAASQGRHLTTTSLSRLLSNKLYHHRFRPYYAFNVVAGLDRDGRGAVFDYDAVGGFGRVGATCVGRGQALLQPLLDRLAESVSEGEGGGPDARPYIDLGWEEAVELVKTAYLSGGEREISIGDELEIVVLLGNGRRHRERVGLAKH